jgi:hypothetical protein
LKVGPTNILSSLLRHHAGLPRQDEDLTQETAQILAALSKARTVQEKYAILEAFMVRQGTLMEMPNPVRKSEGPEIEEHSDATWRISHKSAEAISGLRPEQSSRQWEIDAIIRSIIEQVHAGQAGGHIAGLAMPFKPTPQDMSRAIEALGHSSRAFYYDAERRALPDTAKTVASLPVMRVVLIAFGLLLIAAAFLSI